VTAKSERTVAVVASMLPFSNTVRHSSPCSLSASSTIGRNAQVSATIETGKGRLARAAPPLAPTQTSRSTTRHSPADGPTRSSITASSIAPAARAAASSGDEAQTSEISTCG
jgi:hypothetical protein